MFANANLKVGISQRVVATLVACAVVLMSVGIYGNAQAANLINVKDTLSNSDPGALSDHTIQFVTPTGVSNTQTITIDFSDGPFVLGSVDFSDVDVATTSDLSVAAACGGATDVSAVFSAGPLLTLTLCAGGGESIPAGATTTIQIGDNAIGGSGNDQLTNPGSQISYELVITAGAADTGRTRVAIIENVLVSAIVDTTFNFTISGVSTSTVVNGETTTGITSATSIDYGALTAGAPEVLAQRLNVTTNANNGFVVTVESDGDFASANGAVIDNFDDGSDVDQPGTTWNAPSNSIGDETTWGHWGVTTGDADIGSLGGYYSSTNFGVNEFIAASTTPREVFHHNGPSNGSDNNIGSTTVAYKVAITALQEAADDYNTTLTYIATPTF